jgi:hypothetical protein
MNALRPKHHGSYTTRGAEFISVQNAKAEVPLLVIIGSTVTIDRGGYKKGSYRQLQKSSRYTRATPGNQLVFLYNLESDLIKTR